MSTDPDLTESSPSPTEAAGQTQQSPGAVSHGRRFKRRELDLGEGAKLVLGADGSISQVDAAGASGSVLIGLSPPGCQACARRVRRARHEDAGQEA